MPTFVYMTRCDGCGHCVDICPSDIMHIDTVTRQGLQHRTEHVLGVLLLRQSLPASSHRRTWLRGFRASRTLGTCEA